MVDVVDVHGDDARVGRQLVQAIGGVGDDGLEIRYLTLNQFNPDDET